ncbi:MAG TPA: anthranilate synthase component I [Parvularculaceae bacterium]|nr:anthranilate synthase component I [Parvularculaceae bacterium]
MSLSPGFAEFDGNYAKGKPQVVIRRIVSDLETPVSAYLKLAGRRRNAFLLESVDGGEKLGRYSVIGMRPDAIWRARGSQAEINRRAAADLSDFKADDHAPLESLRAFVDESAIDMPASAPSMAAGVFGFFGYDMARQIERLPNRPQEAFDLVDALFVRPTLIAVFDNLRQEIVLVATARAEDGLSARAAYDRAAERIEEAVSDLAAPLATPRKAAVEVDPGSIDMPASNTPENDYRKMVEKAKEHIAAGDIFQVVLSQRFQAPFPRPPFDLYRSLRRLNPSPFLFFLDFGEFALVGSSPEILVRVRHGEVTIRPIAGTRPRGASQDEDARLAEELLRDPKERAEHLMLLDLGRNDVGRSAAMGSVEVTEQFTIERYSHVMHIVSNVVGRLRSGLHAVDAVAAGFPAGTVTGAPKIRAMEIIDSLEREARGPYGGAIGYFAADGNVDTCIALRTALIKDGVMHVQAGAGIVADSDAQSEHRECVNKARALFAAARSALG